MARRMKPRNLRQDKKDMKTWDWCSIIKQRHATNFFKQKGQRVNVADATRICNGNALVDVVHREKDISVHDVGRHGSDVCTV